jgi:O-antigen/teichoic acid export membrane protein
VSIGKNTAVGLVTDILVFGLGILVSIVLTRSLGAEQRGIYALLVTTNFVLTNIAGLSMGIACSTFLARGRYRTSEVNTIAIVLALALGAIALVGTTLAFSFLQRSVFREIPYAYLLVALLLTPISIYQSYWNSMMVGLNRLLLLNKLNLVVNMASATMMILVVGVFQAGIPGFLAVWALSSMAGALSALVLAARIERLAWPPNRVALRDMLSFGLRSHGASIAYHLFLRLDIYAVNAIVGTRGVGVYSLSTSLAEKLWVPLNAIHASSVPKIAQLPRAESALLTAKVTRTALLLMLGMAIPLAIVSPWLIPLLYGPEFATSVAPLVVLLVGTLGYAAMLVMNSYILGQMQRPGLLSIIAWLELAVSAPLYLALILWQGIIGAAIASTLTYLLAMACTLYVFMRDSALPIHQVLLPRASDFRDYARVIRQLMHRMPVLGRYVSRPW